MLTMPHLEHGPRIASTIPSAPPRPATLSECSRSSQHSSPSPTSLTTTLGRSLRIRSVLATSQDPQESSGREEEEDEEEKREESERRETADAEVKEGNEENDEQTEGVEKTEVEELRDETAPPDAQATTDSGEEEVKADEGVHDKGGDEKDVKSGNEETETDTETATVTATTEEAEVDHDHENQKDVQEIKQTTPEQGAAETNQASAKIPQKARSSWGGSLFGWRSKEPKGDTQDKSKATARLSMSMTTKPDSHMTSEVCKLLLKDLETLETNTPRSQYRYRELLKSAERIIRDIDEEHHDQDSLTKSIRSSDAILKIALQASESKTANLSRMGLSMLQRLAACDGIDPDEFVKASNVFRLAVDSTDEAFQLRIVQLCSTSLQSPRICFHEKAMLLCIETLLSLHGSRYTHAAQIANLSIKSSLEGFFDLLSKLYEGECREAIIVMQELAKKSTEAEPADLESHVTMIGSHLFREFSSIIKLETSKKLQFRPHFSVCPMILGILDDILRAESKIFHKSKSFLNILNDQICSVLVYQLQRVAEAGTRAFVMKDSKQAVSAQDINIAIVRLLRCCSAVISYYSAPNSDDDCNDDCESNLLSCVANMISLFVHMAQEAKPSWLKLAALECLHEYTTSDELPTRLKKIHIVSSELNQSSDAENVIDMEMDAFAAIVSNYLDPPHPKETKNTRSSKQMVAAQRELPVKNFLSITEDEKMSWKRIIDTVSGEEPVLPPDWDTIAFELAIICSSNLSCAMNEMCNLQRPISTSSLSSFEDYPSYTVTDTKPDEESASSKVCNHMIDSWTISLMGLTRLCMQHIENDRLLQLVLRSLCSYMQASNELRQFHSRDLALSIICKAVGAPAPDSTTQLPARPRLLILDSIIRMVFDLGEDMQHSWKILFPVLQYWTANIANFGLQTKLSVYMKDKTSEASTSLGFAQEDVKFLKHVSRGIDKIFEDSDKLSRDACMSLLKTLEQAAVPTEKEEAQDGSVEDAADKNNLNSVYFGMSCAFVVAESNHARLEEIWDSLQTTIVKLCIHEESQIRKAAISIFERFVDSFLEKRDLAKASDDKLEKSMLGSLAEIFNQSPKEVKMEILRCIFEILKKRGKSIKSSWSILMQTFTNISKSNDVALVKEGIKCVSLVSSEFLSELDEKEFSSFLHLAIAFGRQTLDLETSLAAITSLRDCAEFVTAKLIAEEEEQEEEKESTRIEKVQLWLSIVDALLKLGSDKRENVRNESVKVLLDMLLEDERVKQQFHDKMGIVIQSFIFPYMEQIEQTTFEAVAEGSKSTQQWLSTWLTVFDGACKLIQLLFTLHLEHQGTLPDDVDETWKTFISRLVFAFECRSELIIRSAVCSISIMVKSMSKTFPRSMWDSLWECFESQVKKSCAKKLHKTGVVWEITDEMFDLVDDAITLSPQLVGHETIARLIHILGVIVSQEKAEEKEVVSHYKRMAKLLGGREVIEQVTLWHELVSSLLCLLPGDERSYEWTVNLNYTFAQRPARSKEEISAASQLLAELFCDEAAVVVQTNLFERIVVTFLVCVCSRSSSQAAVPWNDIVTSLERVLKAGMPIIQTASGISEEDKSQVWHNIVDGFSTVLTTPAAHAKDAQTFELDEVDGMMMRIVSSILAPLASRIDMHVDVLRIFDAILEDSCKQAALELPLRVKRSALSRRALQELMTLASWSPAAGVQADKVDFAAKIVIERIRTVLEMHANLGSSVPEPPDKSWLELAISSIKSLESLRLSPSCFDLLVEELEPPRSYAMDELPARTEEEEKALRKRSSRLHDRSSQTGHLLLLYSTLCKCILSSNREIRAMAKTLLEKVGEEIGLHAPM
uniref:Protein MON2 homolog n=1 Tax=Guillardia theta TaxID=55529 RepID=A0A7S4N7H7_GUITH|mmetsp:Transcript_17731/g.58342  ORF Transcript_17731/g.58342 Transcript_17731/m.58342 type:complete len:1830 (+) Transcript_17731:211-5700(+)